MKNKYKKINTFKFALLSSLSVFTAFYAFPLSAHHGVASLGVAGLQGPGAPIESSTSATLPEGKVLGYFKMDHANFETYSTEKDSEVRSNTFLMAGTGYGFTSYFSAYAFLPYNVKKTEDNSYNTANTADLSLMGVLGFRYDGTLRLVPESESLDDMEDWHFNIYSGMSIPTGNPNERDSSGHIDPGMSTGFGSPSYSVGVSVTKLIGRFTLVNDTSYISFDPYRYDDGMRVRFGRDREKGIKNDDLLYAVAAQNNIAVPESDPWGIYGSATGLVLSPSGGDILYVLTGFRFFKDNIGLALGVKVPVWTKMDSVPVSHNLAFAYAQGYYTNSSEEEAQTAVLDAYWENVVFNKNLYQGGEGRERYRVQFSLSFMM
jgi:hypothetical protein